MSDASTIRVCSRENAHKVVQALVRGEFCDGKYLREQPVKYVGPVANILAIGLHSRVQVAPAHANVTIGGATRPPGL